jgi:hypothetical protein
MRGRPRKPNSLGEEANVRATTLRTSLSEARPWLLALWKEKGEAATIKHCANLVILAGMGPIPAPSQIIRETIGVH